MKKVKQILFSCSLFLFGCAVHAQQETIITMYTEQMNIVNPAFAGVNGTNLSIGNRKLWMGVNNAPVSQMLVFDTSVGKNLGIGISAISDKTFIENRTNVGIDFSYRVKMNPETDLFLGLKAGANLLDINTASLLTFNPSSDPGLLANSSFNPNIGIGALLKKENSYLSLSIPRLINTVSARNEDDQTFVSIVRQHVYLNGGYEYDFETRSELILKPSFMLRYVKGVPVSMDINIGVAFHKNFELAAVYRSNNAVGGIAKITLSDRFLLGYAYVAATRTDLARIMNTNEFILQYNFRSKQ